MHEVFLPYLERYDRDLRSGKERDLKRLFYTLPVHSHFVLLAFLIGGSDEAREFLRDQLGIDPDEGVESILFVLRQPPWKSKAGDGDPRFWNARGVVRDFLDRLYAAALAPITTTRSVKVSLWNKTKLDFQYLYLKNVQALRDMVGDQSPAAFFRDLESTHVSQLIHQVRIRIRLANRQGTVTFQELSEGEQQLLTVLGLLRFTAGSESLFLLDEPDTHLNPAWSVKFLKLLRDYGGHPDLDRQCSHVLVTTHNPLAIAELQREQVQILLRSETGVQATRPAEDPRGMGFASIVTSDMFGLGSSLDAPTTQEVLDLHRLAMADELDHHEERKLDELRRKLEKLDFNFAARDPIEQAFLRARFDLTADTIGNPVVTPENKRLAIQVLVKALLQGVRLVEQ
jgi:ABC-type transport system involved in cytochrome c biogenesis ATPase subunit